MKHKQYVGTGVALITPFRAGKVDFPAIEKIIDHVIEGGVEYIVMLGSTGEMATLNAIEAREILDVAIKKINSRVPLVAGNFAGNNTLEVARQISEFSFEGIDAIVSKQIRDALLQVVKQGATVFLTSHVLEIVDRLCTHVGIIHKGKLVAQGAVDELSRDGQHQTIEEIFLSVVDDPDSAPPELSWLGGTSK